MAKKDVSKNKLNAEHKAVIYKMLGAFCPSIEIQDYLNDEFGIKINLSTISYYKRNKTTEIMKGREEYQKSVVCYPVTQKTWRLRIRQRQIEKLIREHNKDCADPKKKKETKNNVDTLEISKSLAVNKILDSAREELEPRKVSITDPTGKEDTASKLLSTIISNGEKSSERAAEILKNDKKTKRTPASSDV